jgi:hypothetical protein
MMKVVGKRHKNAWWLLRVFVFLQAVIVAFCLLLIILPSVVSARSADSFSAENATVIQGRRNGIILSVPSLNQGDTRWCFDTALAMVMQYRGVDISAANIASAFHQTSTDSINLLDIIIGRIDSFVANNAGLKASCLYGVWGFADYKKEIDDGNPVIVSSFGLPFTKPGHTVVVTGYFVQDDRDYIVFNDPSGFLSGSWNSADGCPQSQQDASVSWDDFKAYSNSAWTHVLVQ